MKLEELKTINQLSQFLDGTQSVIFKINADKSEHYHWIRRQLIRFNGMVRLSSFRLRSGTMRVL